MNTFVSELRRRNVLRVGTAYALAAWIIIEAGSVLLPTFGASEGTFQTYVIVVLAGFVVSIVFAWIFEMTPEGVKLDKDVDRAAPAEKPSSHTMNYAIIGLLIVALAVSITFNVTGIRDRDYESPTFSGVPKSIAVLPFASRSSNPDNIIFADGIHDDILTKLAKIAALKVISRTSVMEYRDTTKNVREIGRELGVDTILSGTVQRIGDNVRINMTLIDAETDISLWAESFDRQLTMQGIFALQSEISESVSGTLQTALSPTAQQRIASIPTADLRAYNRYHEARENLSYRRRETLLEARTQFEEAVAFDPEYAEAHAGLAESILLLMINHQEIPFDEALALAQQEIDRALALDPDLADAHAIEGLLKVNVWSRNRLGSENIDAETSFRRAIALNPNHASAHMWFASLRDNEDKLDEAIQLYQKAMDLDPLARIPFSNLPMIYAKQGHHREALDLWVNATDVHPEWPTIYEYIAVHLMGMGRLDEAFAWNREARELTSDPFIGGNINFGIYITFGEIEKAKALLAEFPDDHPLTPLIDGFRLLVDGDNNAALRFFEKIIDSGSMPPDFVYDIASDIALLVNELDLARKYTLLKNPILASDAELQVNRRTADNIIKLAYIHKETGNEKRAYELLSATLPVVQELPRLGTFGYGISDVHIFALLGRTEDALSTLRAAVNAGYRGSIMQNNWLLEEDPYLKSIRDDPRFVAIVSEIQSYIEVMRINLEQTQTSGNWDSLLGRVKTT